MVKREQIAAEMATRRTMMMERARAGSEQLARRAEEIRERFAEDVTGEVVANFAGWTLVSSGVAWGVTDWMRGRRRLTSLVMPIGLVALGVSILGGGRMWQRRSETIGEAEQRVRDEIAGLDPLARLRVLRDVAGESVPFIRRISVRN